MPEDKRTEKLADRIETFELSADGEKMLLALSNRNPDAPPEAAGDEVRPTWIIVPANAPLKPGDGTPGGSGRGMDADVPRGMAHRASLLL